MRFKLWVGYMRDRRRMVTFVRFVWKRFIDDHLFQAAAALAYTSTFALVPLAMVVFGVLSAFPVFSSWSDQLSDYVFSHFVPDAARAVEVYLKQFSESTKQLTAAGVIILVVSLLITLSSVEGAFNQIWRVASARAKLSRFLVYWTVLTLGAMLAAASLAVSATVFAMPLFSTPEGRLVEGVVLRMTPMLIEFGIILLLYRVVPHHIVRWRPAMIGALLAVVILELVRWGMGAYLGSFQSYQKIYGAVAFVPIFLLWIYLGWVSILLGASLASSIAAFRYQPVEMQLPVGYEIYGLLRLLGRFIQARRRGEGLDDEKILHLEPMLTDSLVQELLEELGRIRLVRRDEEGQWLLARDLDEVSVGELYETCHLRVPMREIALPSSNDALGVAACKVMEDLRLPLRELLQRPVGRFYRPAVGDTKAGEGVVVG